MTATIVAWLPVFCAGESFQIIMRRLKYCRRERGCNLYASSSGRDEYHGDHSVETRSGYFL
jgi:hypothetical protein